eukprot:scaffold2738_cov366-Prasinococcus_capsulatus_cf.AAC.9
MNEEGLQEAGLRKLLIKFRDEEQEHLDMGIHKEAEKAPLYGSMSMLIKTGCKAAIQTAMRI